MKILVLNHFINNFTGSEINAMQLCEGLRSLGIQADIGALIVKPPLEDLVREKGIRIINLYEQDPQYFDYDVIWAHHAPVLAYLLFKKNIADTRILFSSLSPILAMEGPPLFLQDVQTFLALSAETEQILVKNGVPPERIQLFPNFAPAHYFDRSRSVQAVSPRKIAIVSNHVPGELREFAGLARLEHIQVDLFGREDGFAYVDDNLLLQYDLVITIGKTVQYCFALQVPVYVYDYFGGPGYITPANFDLARKTNFSGRGVGGKRDKDQLLADVLGGYAGQQAHLDFLYQTGRENFCLETNLQKILTNLEGTPALNIKEFRENNVLAERSYDCYLDLLQDVFSLQAIIRGNMREIERVSQQNQEYQKEIALLQERALLPESARVETRRSLARNLSDWIRRLTGRG